MTTRLLTPSANTTTATPHILSHLAIPSNLETHVGGLSAGDEPAALGHGQTGNGVRVTRQEVLTLGLNVLHDQRTSHRVDQMHSVRVYNETVGYFAWVGSSGAG